MTFASSPCRMKALKLGTALATTMFAGGLALPAFGQSLPVVNGSPGADGGATIVTNANDQQINLNDANRVINFDSYNVGAGKTVNYLTNNATNQYAVLNRVIGANFSQIDGSITGQNNIVVWLSNPNGILVSSTGSFNTGGLVLTTLDVDPSTFTTGAGAGGAFNLSGAGTTAISLGAGSSLVTTGAAGGFAGGLIVVAPQITASGTISGSGDVALVAAQDVSFTTGIGSPLALTINAGTKVGGAMIDADATAQITGSSVGLVAASDATVMGALLNVDAGASLTATGSNGAVILATKDVANIAVPENGDAIVSNGSLSATGTGGDVIVAAAGAATVGGAVSANDAYTVSGSSVALGNGSPVVQSAGGNVDITATAGNIIGATGLILRSDADTVGGGFVVLDAGSGAIDFALGSSVQAGSTGSDSVGLVFGGTQDLNLGDVKAVLLGGVSGAAGARNTFTGAITTTGNLRAGTLALSGVETYSIGGNMRLASLTAGEINLTVGGDLTGLAGASTGTSDTNFGRADLTATSSAVTATVGGLAQLGAVSGLNGIAITAGNASSDGAIDATSLTTTSVAGLGGNISLTATANAPGDAIHDGDIRIGSASAAGAVSLVNTAGDSGAIAVTGDLTAGAGVTVNAETTATLAGNVTASGGDYTVTGSGIVLGNGSGAVTQQASGAVSLTPGAGGITLAGDVTLASTGGGAISLNGAVDGAHALTLNTGGDTNLGNVGATTALSSLTTDAGGNTFLNGGVITTTGAQTFGDTVNLNTSVTATGTTGTAAAVVGNGNDLTLNYTGLTFINGNLTGVNNLTTGNGGITALSGAISTSGTQSYNDAVVLAGDTTLASSGGGAIGFGSTVNSDATARSLTINTAGTTTFAGAVGTLSALSSLTTDAGGTTAINGGAITTTGAQSFGDPVTLGANTTLTGASGSFAGGITGGGNDLTLNYSGTTAITGTTFSGVRNFATGGGGTTTLAGTISTTGTQTYNDAVTLAGATTLVSSGAGAAGNVTFNSTLDGAQALAINTAGITGFLGAVGSGTALTSITTDAPGETDINGGAVITTGAQTYNDDVVLSADATLTSATGGAVTFTKTVNSQTSTARALTVNTSGATTFGGAVGGTNALASLATDATGTTAINGGAVTTTGAQTYGDATTLGTTTTLTSNGGGAVRFADMLNGPGGLFVTTTGLTRFDGVVGGTSPLAFLNTGAGGIALNGAAITTSGVQNYNSAVALGADVTLTAGVAGVTFVSTIDGTHALTVNTAGNTVFGGRVGTLASPLTSVTTDANGTTVIVGGAITTSGAQTYGDAVSLLVDTTLTGGSGSFAAGVDGNDHDLTLNFGGTTALDGSFVEIKNLATGNGGTTTLSGSITTTGAQTYGDAVMLGAATTLNAGGNVTFGSTLDGAQTLAVNTSGTTAFLGAVGATTALTSITTDAGGETDINGGVVNTTGAQTYNDDVVLSADATLTTTMGGDITFAKTVNSQTATARALAVNTAGTTTFGGAVGGGQALASVTTDAPGTTAINGGLVNTSGAQIYSDAVTLGNATTLTSTGNGAIAFASTLNGAQTLAVNTGGSTTFGGAVGNTAALISLTTDAPGTTALNDGLVNTSGAQSYNDAVTLGAGTTLNAGGNVTFSSALNGAQSLAVNTSGTTAFIGAVGNATALTSLTTDAGGETDINGGVVNTTGAQTYNDDVVLSADATLTSSGGSVTFGKTVNSQTATARALTVNSGAATTFTGAVGNAFTLSSLTTDAAGTTAINGGLVNTSGAQTYNDAVTLGAATTLNAGGNVTFASTLDGAQTLAVNTAATTAFLGAVGATTALTSITTDAPGETDINGGAVITTGAQTYNDDVVLSADTTLTSAAGGAVTFAKTANSQTSTARALSVNTSGATTFGGAVGGTNALASLTTDTSGTTAINGGLVNTSGAQTYNDAVTLGAATTLTAGGNVTFGSTLNGAQTLAVNTGATTAFLDAVGAITALTSITTDAPGETDINGGVVNTTGAQTYNDDVVLSADAALTSTGGGDITFAKTVNSQTATARELAVNTAGTTTFGGAVGGGQALASVTTDAPGTTAINGGLVNTSGAQIYSDAVTLGNATTLNAGGNVTFGSTLNGAQTLEVNTSGTTAFLGAVGATTALTSLTTDAGGETDINGGVVNTTGAQTYNDDVVLSADATLTSTGGGNIAFAGTVDGPFALGINTAGTTTFNGAVGSGTALASVTTDAPGSLALNGGSIRTSGGQTYNDAVTLGVDTTLSSTGNGDIALASTVNGNRALAITTGGDVALSGAVGAINPIASLSINANDVLLANATTQFFGAASLTASGNVRIGTLSAGPIAITASGDVTGLAGASTASDPNFGRANLFATAPITINGGGLVQLGTANAPGPITISAGNLGGSGSDGSIDITSVNATGGLTLTAFASAPTADAAHDGDIIVGTASTAGGTAALSNSGGTSGDIVIAGKLTASGDITVSSARDVLIASYDAGADSGLIRSVSGDVAIDANGSVRSLSGAANTVPTGQRGVAALNTSGNLTVNSDGDARFDSLGATGSITLNIAGSLTGSPLTGGSSTGTNVPGGAIFAQGAGGDVTIRSGLAGAPSNDVVVLDRVVADRNITISADQLAIGTLTTNSGTITLNDTSGAALTADNYYVGLLNAAGDLVVTLTGQPTAAIPLVATDAGGAPEAFDANFGKTDLTAGTSITGTIGQAAQLGDVSFGTTLDLDTAAIVADTLTSANGSADVTATTGTLSVLTTSLGGDLTLTKQGGLASTPGDELRLRIATAGGSATIASSTNARIASLTANGGPISATVGNDLTGLVGTSTGTSDTAFGRASLSAFGDLDVTVGGLAQLGLALGRNGGNVAITAGNAGSDGSIDATSVIANGQATLIATATTAVADSAHDGDIRLGSASAVTALTISNTAAGGNTGDVIVAADFGGASLTAGTDLQVQSANEVQIAGNVTSGGNATIVGAGRTAVLANVTAGGNYAVTGSEVVLGDTQARTQQANGSVTITATASDVRQGPIDPFAGASVQFPGRLTVISNADRVGTEALTISATNGNIVLANSQLTGGSIPGRESDVVLTASGAITTDDLDGDRVGMTAGGNIVADTIEAGTGAADSGDLADRQSIDLVSNGGSVTVNTAQAFGAGHDIDVRAATTFGANSLDAGGSLVARAGSGIAIGTASAGEDVALKSNAGGITISGATTAGDDVLLTAAGAIATGSLTASGTGPDTRTVVFGSASPLDAAYAAETNPGADVVVNSTGSSVTANGAVLAASDVTVNAATSVTHLGATTATAGNVGVTSGTSTQLVGDVASGIDTAVTAGTTASVLANVTAGRNYTVTGGTGVTLGDASARTQQAKGNVAITATTGDVTKGAGRLTVIANADRTAANNAEALTINAANGNITLANSQLTGGSTAGRESDIRLTARGITVGKVDGASLTARATTGFAATEAIVAGNAARGADPVNGASTVDIAVTGGNLSFTDITATNTGHDVVLNASGAISGNNITAARSVIVNGGSVNVTGGTTATSNSVTVNGGSSASLGSLAAGTSGAVTAGAINVGTATTGTTLNLNATGSTLTLGSATSGGDVTLAAETRATLGPITASGRNVSLTTADADINGNITANQITVVDRSAGTNPLRLGDNAAGSGGFALSQAEVNRLNAPTLVLDAGTTGGRANQDVAIGALALDADSGANRLDILGLRRFDLTGALTASGNGSRVLRLGGSSVDGTRATTLRIAATPDAGGRLLVPGVDVDLRADRIGVGQDAAFLATLGLTPGGTPASQDVVETQYIANGASTLYVADNLGGAGAYSSPTLIRADSLTVRYSDYALFQNTGGAAANAGAEIASLADPSAPALFLAGPNPPNAGGFALFGTINGVPDSAAAVLGDQVITLQAIDRLTARVNGCIIGSGSGCIASTTSQPPLPPLNAFRGDIFSTQGDLSIPFDPVVGTNNESLFGDVGSFGLSDLPLQPLACDPEKEGDCARDTEDNPQ